MNGISFLVVSLYLRYVSWNSWVNNSSSNLILLRMIGISTTMVAVAGMGRADINGGHENPGADSVGMIEIVPVDSENAVSR